MSEEGTFLVAAVVLAFRGDRLLALRRAAASDAFAGEWEAISGRLAPGEDPLAAARREAREETGLAVELDPRPVACYALERAGRPTIAVVFRGEAAGGGEVVLSPEHEAWRFATVEEFAALCRFPALVAAARAARELGLPASGDRDPEEIRT